MAYKSPWGTIKQLTTQRGSIKCSEWKVTWITNFSSINLDFFKHKNFENRFKYGGEIASFCKKNSIWAKSANSMCCLNVTITVLNQFKNKVLQSECLLLYKFIFFTSYVKNFFWIKNDPHETYSS